ncbi:cysteine--tRNA ligase [Pseudoflavonifractor sp. DSM 107456]|uniref:Cysteine--tRNA ligase n=2 Tax=Pseudoflavonifractor TaxID=1017280 RepID=A0ABR9R9Z9_9FIRM|nr:MULTISPECIES: cysteine--tRNA ligase [Eubacteriales]MBC5730302.1 cysteine--tRNA ligase [Pseudoflavonifractor hominis]MBE5055520.1 cysteine--tRNA ligase [Pseudoflavonifractor gallinarum]MBS5136487.1 cysteine--tRNA ligase [Oscillospiraceae bacterium]
MKLYNSLTRTKDDFKTHTPGKVEMYTCGPTVYHFAHIGNLRSYIMEDVLEKYLRYAGYDVNRVMNITDVGHLASDADTGEDKMLKGAKREHKTVMEIAQFYTDAFFSDCEKLHIKRPDVVQPATGCIEEYIQIVSGLIEKGYAYLAGGNVYFDTSKLQQYYVFNDHDEEDLAVGVRDSVEEDQNKRNKADFVLWFTKSKFEDQALKWDSPWGVGYPGWHIECSGISMKYNGEYLDLHCGGIDNAFPHHTNEIAQSEAYLGHPWCPQWFHVHHLNTTSGKMSKSKGEFLTVSLLEEKGYDPMVYRFFCLQSHYRKGLVFSWENLDNARTAYDKLIARVAALKDEGELDQAAMDELRASFRSAMDNDLNTSMGVTVLYDVLKAKISDRAKRVLLDEFDQVLSLGLLDRAAKAAAPQAEESAESDPEIDALVAARTQAKKDKNWAEADRIRDELKARGIELIDTKEGTKWKRV